MNKRKHLLILMLVCNFDEIQVEINKFPNYLKNKPTDKRWFKLKQLFHKKNIFVLNSFIRNFLHLYQRPPTASVPFVCHVAKTVNDGDKLSETVEESTLRIP